MQFRRKSNGLNILKFEYFPDCASVKSSQSSLDLYSMSGSLIPVRDAGSCLQGAAFNGYEFHICWAALWFLRILKEPHSWKWLFLKEYFPCVTQSEERGRNRELGPGFFDSWKSGSPIYPPAIPAGILASAPPRSAPKPHGNNGASGTLNIFPWSRASWKCCQGIHPCKNSPWSCRVWS